MKWLKRILLSAFIAIPAMILFIYLLLWIPFVQQKVKDIAISEVTKKTGNKIKIEKLSFRPFNKLTLDKVYIADLKGDTLLYIGTLNAGFDLLQLLNDRLLIKSVELDNVTAKVYRDSLDSSFNFQFLMDAFASEDTAKTKEPSKMSIEIDDVTIKNGTVNFDHIHLTDFNLGIRIKSIEPEKLNMHLKHLSFKEQSGFELKRLEAKLNSDGKKMDLEVFSPELGNIKDPLFLSGTLEGQFPEINLSRFQVSLGETASLEISAKIADFNHWQTSALEVVVTKLYISEKGLKEAQITLPGEFSNTGDINLSGKITGNLSHLNIDLQTSSDLTGFTVNGTAGYVYDTGKVGADIQLDIDRFRYEGYTYRNVCVHGKYLNDSIELELKSNDTITRLPAYPGAELYGKLTMNIKGLNPEKMKASLILDSLMFKTDKGVLFDKQLKIDYLAENANSKDLSVTSDFLDASLQGNFMLNSIGKSIRQTLSGYVAVVIPGSGRKRHSKDRLNINLNIKNPEALEKIMDLPFSMPGVTSVKGNYNAAQSSIELQAGIPDLIYDNNHFSNTSIDLKTDTILHRLNLNACIQNLVSEADSLITDLKIATDVYLEFDKKDQPEKVELDIQSGELKVNGEPFKLTPSRISMLFKEEKYIIGDFSLTHSENEYFKLNGVVSKDPSDSLKLDVAHIQLETLADVLKLKLNLKGEVDGEIILKELPTTPLIFTKRFSIRDIVSEGQNIGTLNLTSDWSNEIRALMFKVDFVRENRTNSMIEGKLFPAEDRIEAGVNINAIPLDWLSPFTTGTLFGLSGDIGASIKVSGSMKAPELKGNFFANNANVGVSMLNTQYKFSDTINITSNQISIENFRITDQNNHPAVLNGIIQHRNFAEFNPKLNLDFHDFLVLNNAQQTDSLFYGTLRINGNLKVTSNNKDVLLNARLTNSPNSTIMVTVPESADEAQRYSSITFINTGEDSIVNTSSYDRRAPETRALPVKLNISLSIDPGLKTGAVFNPQTKDAATFTGTGTIDFSYDMNSSKMSLLGVYTIKEGNCTLSLKNITKKSFSIKEGGTLSFRGDPMSTTFSATAVYSTRVDLTTLDKNFGNIVATTKIPANATLSVSGDLNKMNLKYDIEFPGEREEIKRKADGLMYSDDVKIREFAYLLAFNTFFQVNSSQSRNMGTDLWTSLASSTITSQLNNLLSGVLSENWSIGTELHANNGNMSDVEMDVNVSTRLFDDRMTVSSNIGYKNTSSSATNGNDNFTGDFDIQFKLTKSGNVILKAYDITNNQYFERAKRTQGVGIMYRKEARTFKKLFQKIKSIIKK
ncbi:MAG: translocation/assembly module TamB domain-containing protein [Dysgonamonadaceae bacterium]|jgi:hypothetical protein|nr:translocation/assembly module TamB domain-containing protein [Dysgonamonadaceae bacterium]